MKRFRKMLRFRWLLRGLNTEYRVGRFGDETSPDYRSRARAVVLTLKEQGPGQRFQALRRPYSGSPVSLASPPHLSA